MKRLTADHRYAPSLAWHQNSTIDFERALKPIDVKYLERLLRETEREVGSTGAKSRRSRWRCSRAKCRARSTFFGSFVAAR